MPPTTPVTPDLKPDHDAAARLWTAVERAHEDFVVNRRKLGKLFYQLKNLYSERANSAARRLTSGRGVFQIEINKRGYRPNRVREWICDYEVEVGLRPPAESTAAKRKARRVNSSVAYERGYQAAMNDFPTASSTVYLGDPVSRFAALLPFAALKAAYHKALHELHPDHGGSEERTRALISAWEDVERLHCSAAAGVEEYARVN
jgi:hypothetical protein